MSGFKQNSGDDALGEVLFEIVTIGNAVKASAVHVATNTEVSVIGIPHPHWGECVHAIVVPRNGAVITAESVQAHCRTLLAAYKCPRSVELRSESLPVSAAGTRHEHADAFCATALLATIVASPAAAPATSP